MEKIRLRPAFRPTVMPQLVLFGVKPVEVHLYCVGSPVMDWCDQLIAKVMTMDVLRQTEIL